MPQDPINVFLKENKTAQKVGPYVAEILRGLGGVRPVNDPEGKKSIFQQTGPGRANAMAEVLSNIPAGAGKLLAGLPFLAVPAVKNLLKVAGKPSLFHGTKKIFDKFDLAKNNKSDTLGWMTHAAEDPKYAEEYSGYLTGSPQIIPITPKSENVLDIYDTMPRGDDWEKVKAAHEALVREPGRLNNPRLSFDPNPAYDSKGILGYYDEVLNRSNGTNREFIRSLRNPFNDPELLERAGFDAIRYSDINKPAWAFPKPEKLETPWGIPLGDEEATKKFIEGLKKSKNQISVPSNFGVSFKPGYQIQNPEVFNDSSVETSLDLLGVPKKTDSAGNPTWMKNPVNTPSGWKHNYGDQNVFKGNKDIQKAILTADSHDELMNVLTPKELLSLHEANKIPTIYSPNGKFDFQHYVFFDPKKADGWRTSTGNLTNLGEGEDYLPIQEYVKQFGPKGFPEELLEEYNLWSKFGKSGLPDEGPYMVFNSNLGKADKPIELKTLDDVLDYIDKHPNAGELDFLPKADFDMGLL